MSMSSMWEPANSWKTMPEVMIGVIPAIVSRCAQPETGHTEFHQRSSVRRHHHPYPVQGIRAVRGHDAVERHLAHDQEDEQRQLHASAAQDTAQSTYAGPCQLLLERGLGFGRRDLGEKRREGLDEIQKPY